MKRVPTNWFLEFVTPDLIQQFSIRDILYTARSEYQSIEIIDTTSFGKCLILDGKIQCSQRDEFIYHEALVQPPMILHPQPKSVFIAGGGEGATLREVLAHNSVERVVMIDIDPEVIETCRKLLPELSQGSFEDSRLKLHYLDARKYLAETKERFDVIILDLAEPLEEGPAYLLFTREFYQITKERLKEDGVLSLQAGLTSMVTSETFTAVTNTLKGAFPIVAPYQAEIPSFGGSWGFALASRTLDPSALSPQEIDGRLLSRLKRPLRFYDGLTHQGMFSIPKYLREAIERENRVITDGQPLFAH